MVHNDNNNNIIFIVSLDSHIETFFSLQRSYYWSKVPILTEILNLNSTLANQKVPTRHNS